MLSDSVKCTFCATAPHINLRSRKEREDGGSAEGRMRGDEKREGWGRRGRARERGWGASLGDGGME